MTKKVSGRIIRSISGFYDVQTGEGTVTCRARGILRKEGQSPLTGDLVEITVEKGKGMVEKILPRKNHFIRPAVANVDVLVIFAASVNPMQILVSVASVISTTGFATVDFNLWPELSRTLLVLIMFIGACAGSTGGGLKVSRVILLFKSIYRLCSQRCFRCDSKARLDIAFSE